MTTPTVPAATPAAEAAGSGDRPRIFSGIQPSGIVHLGNDLGAIRNYVRLQAEYEAIYCIVDYHALTSTHDAEVLRGRTREMAASFSTLKFGFVSKLNSIAVRLLGKERTVTL